MMNSVQELSKKLENKLHALPEKPGVYLMRNLREEVIYVGKAVNLLHRVRSYFHASAQEHPKTRRLVAAIQDIEWIITDSEVEALILEANLIKKYRPRYNVRLKDDKRYPYLKILNEDFPRVRLTRRMKRDGARYFGPYTSSKALRETMDLLRRLFPYRTCNRTITGEDERACLYRDLDLCLAPCVGDADAAEYEEMVAQLVRFMEGETEGVLVELKGQIGVASDKLRFERAGKLRDRYQALKQVLEHQHVISTATANQDVIALAHDENNACVEIFFVRQGKLLGREYFVLENSAFADDEELVTSFLEQFYTEAANVPPEILLPAQITQAAVLEKWLRAKRGDLVYLNVPRNKPEQELLDFAAKNATETLRMLKVQWDADRHRNERALNGLEEVLALPGAPVRMEGYDISTTQGVEVVGSMVVFEHGVPKKSHYRRFKIRTVQGQDDFASMREVLTRRFDRWHRITAGELIGVRGNRAWAKLPDLLVVDGGKGQLSMAVEVLAQFDLRDKVPVIGLAKRHEEIFLPGRKNSIELEPSAPEILLLRHLRDEAHRFAINYHRKRRRKRALASPLDGIPGIGPIKRKALLKHFGSLHAIQQASEEELKAVRGISHVLAGVIQRYFAAKREAAQEGEAV